MTGQARIHPAAIIDPGVKLADDVCVGPYAIIRSGVEIGPGSVVLEHTVLNGPTIIGGNCRIGPAAYVGMDPQHLRYVHDPNNPTYLVIGDNVTIRESARIHRATHSGKDHATRIGNGCFLMGAIHVAHDCVLENDVIMADGALLGGHCHIGARAFLGGGCTLHQFVHIGRLVVIAGNEALSNDIPPFGAVRYGRLKGYNAVGCRRAGMDRKTIAAIRSCYQSLRDHRQVGNALGAMRSDLPDLPEVREIIAFIESSRRGLPPAHRAKPDASRFGAGPSGEGGPEGDL